MSEQYIKRCIELARKGEGWVAPNPLVGAVVLDIDGNVVGEGYHQKYGDAHAEVNALNQAGEKARGGTIFVSLEPCSHFGKTPPCADLIIERGIKKLVVGMVDPNPKVSGQGIEKCKNAEIEVITGILEEECKKLNEIFIKNITKQKPFVAIKSAITMDGKIAAKTGSSKWITSEAARNEVQIQRNKYDAILTGSGTILADNPSLTCRMENGRNPARIIVDSRLITPSDSKVYNNDGAKVYIAVNEDVEKEQMVQYSTNVEFIKCPIRNNNKLDLVYLTEQLYKKGITGLVVEAGGKMNGEFISDGIVDKVYLFIAPKILGDESAKNWVEGFDIADINDSLNLKFADIKQFPPDIMIEAYL